MNNEIFRKKSIDKVTSPEQLNDYVKVSNPSVWMVLTAIVLLLAGACIWGIFGRLDTTVTLAGSCENRTITCYVKESDISKFDDGTKIEVNGKEYDINRISEAPIVVDDSFEAYTLYVGDLQKGEWVYPVTAFCDLDSGTYKVTATIESVSPMSFVFN